MLTLFSIIFLSCGEKDEDTSIDSASEPAAEDSASEDEEIEDSGNS